MVKTKINYMFLIAIIAFILPNSKGLYAAVNAEMVEGPNRKSCSYLLKQSFSYNLPIDVDINSFSKAELLKFKNKEFIKKHSFSIDADNEYSHTVNYISSKNINPDWLPFVTENVVFQKDGYNITSRYSKNNSKTQVKTYNYTKYDLETFHYKKKLFTHSGLSSSFFTTAEILHFAHQSSTATVYFEDNEILIVDGNMEIKLLENGNYIIQDVEGISSVYIDPENLFITAKEKLAVGVKKVMTTYVISEEGYLLPQKLTVTTPKVLASGNCIEERITKEYSDFQFEGFEVGQFKMDLDEGVLESIEALKRSNLKDIHLFPNPVTETLYLNNLSNASSSKFLLTDVNGKRIACNMQCTDENSISLNIASIPAGVYFISILTEKTTETYKFFKQ